MSFLFRFFFNLSATTEFYTSCHTLSLHDALPISPCPVRSAVGQRQVHRTGQRDQSPTLLPSRLPATLVQMRLSGSGGRSGLPKRKACPATRSEEHTSELQSLMRISYAVFCLKNKKRTR